MYDFCVRMMVVVLLEICDVLFGVVLLFFLNIVGSFVSD